MMKRTIFACAVALAIALGSWTVSAWVSTPMVMSSGFKGTGGGPPPSGCGFPPVGDTSGVNNNCYLVVGVGGNNSGTAVWSGNLLKVGSGANNDGPSGNGYDPGQLAMFFSLFFTEIAHINSQTCVTNNDCAAEVVAAARGDYNTNYANLLSTKLDPYKANIVGIVIDNEWPYTWQQYGPFGGAGGETSPQFSCTDWNNGVQNLINAIRADHNLDNAKIGMFSPLDNTAEGTGCGNVTKVDYVDYHLYEGTGCGGSTAAASWSGCLPQLQFVDGYANRKAKPYTFSEWCSFYPDPYMIQQMQTWMNTHNVIFQAYWDDQSYRDPGISGNNWCALNGSTAKQNAFTAAWPPTYTYSGTFWPLHP